MKYHEILFKHFGELTEDVLKIESLLRVGDNELATQVSQYIPNYEEKMLEVYKEYYPTFGEFLKMEYHDMGDNEILQYFFSYHLAKELCQHWYKGERGMDWMDKFWMYFDIKKTIEVELPFHIKSFSTWYFSDYKSNFLDISIPNASDLQTLSTIRMRGLHRLDIIDLPKPSNLYIIDWRYSKLVSGGKDFYNKITKLEMYHFDYFEQSPQEYLFKFANLKEMVIQNLEPIDIKYIFELPYIYHLKINECALPNSKTVFNNIYFVEVKYPTRCSSGDIKKMLDMGFEYESSSQCNLYHYITYKNTRL